MNAERKAEITEALRSWVALNKITNTMTEVEVRFALSLEQRTRNRATFVTRLMQRLRGIRIEKVRRTVQ